MKALFLSTTSTTVEPIIQSFVTYMPSTDTDTFFYDRRSAEESAREILEIVGTKKPDVVFYLSVAGGEFLQPIDTFLRVRREAGLIHICFDASCPDWHRLLEDYKTSDCFDLTVNLDGNPNWPKRDGIDLTLWAPIDPIPYAFSSSVSVPSFLKRPVRLGFQGGCESSPRKPFFDELKDKLTIQSRDSVTGTYQKYADFMQSCQMVINMGASGSGRSMQLKARCIETGLAHAMLLEEKGSPASLYFKKGIDYVEFSTPQDVVDILHEIDTASAYMFANSLSRTVRSTYTAKHFWDRVLKGGTERGL